MVEMIAADRSAPDAADRIGNGRINVGVVDRRSAEAALQPDLHDRQFQNWTQLRHHLGVFPELISCYGVAPLVASAGSGAAGETSLDVLGTNPACASIWRRMSGGASL